MAGMDFEAEASGMGGTVTNAHPFLSAEAVSPWVKASHQRRYGFQSRGPDGDSRLDLHRIRRDEKRHADSGLP